MPETAAQWVHDMVRDATADTRPERQGPRPKKRRRRVPDGRFWVVRRTKQLIELYTAQLGEAAADPIVAAQIRRASEVVALADDLRNRRMCGDNSVTPDDIVRTSRLGDLLTRRLHLDRHKQQPQQQNLTQYLAANGDGEVRGS